MTDNNSSSFAGDSRGERRLKLGLFYFLGAPLLALGSGMDQSFAIYRTNGRHIEVVVQTIPWHQMVGKEWKVIADFAMEGDKSVGENVSSMGACL